MTGLISRQAAIDAIDDLIEARYNWREPNMGEIKGLNAAMCAITDLPSADSTLYGYRVEHLALIAAVMAKKHITPDDAVDIFTDASRIVEMVRAEFEESMRKAMESVI